MTALNVQHLEGVQDVVQSATGIEIRERVPDRIVRQADSVVVVDLPVPELLERLRQGKIYPPEQAARALQNFFRAEMLVRLRELALLQTADYSGRDLPLDMTSAAAEMRIAVAVPYDPVVAKALILRALGRRSEVDLLGLGGADALKCLRAVGGAVETAVADIDDHSAGGVVDGQSAQSAKAGAFGLGQVAQRALPGRLRGEDRRSECQHDDGDDL